MKISVIGAGGWGTTLSILLHYNGHNVTLWEYDKKNTKHMLKHRENEIYLPGIKIPEELNITSDLLEASYDKNMIVLAVPSQYLRHVVKEIKPYNIKDTILVSVSKGIENNSLLTMSQMLQVVFEDVNPEQIGVLSGPSHAEEVSRRIPTAVVCASEDKNTAKTIQSTFMTSYFRVYTTTDILGVELGGAFKNVIAIGAGIIDGAKFGG